MQARWGEGVGIETMSARWEDAGMKMTVETRISMGEGVRRAVRRERPAVEEGATAQGARTAEANATCSWAGAAVAGGKATKLATAGFRPMITLTPSLEMTTREAMVARLEVTITTPVAVACLAEKKGMSPTVR